MGGDDINIDQMIYQANKNSEPSKENNKSNNTKSYEEILNIIRELVSTNDASELANVLEDESAQSVVKALISKYVRENRLNVKEIDSQSELVDKIYEDMAGFAFLDKYLYDDFVEEINGNSWRDIEIVTPEGSKKIPERFINEQHCIDVVKKMMRLGGITIDDTKPTADSYITQGVRISAIIPPCVDKETGAVFSIRKQKDIAISKEQIVKWGTATSEEIELIMLCILNGVSIGIAGATSSGKTTDITCFLTDDALDNKRIYTIEDSREINAVKVNEDGIVTNRVIHTKTRRDDKNKDRNVDENVLLRRALRFHPDLIVPAEMRGEEALTAVESGRTGHTILTGFHASDALDAYTRILTMCMMSGIKLSEELMMKLIISAFPIMVFKKQLPDKSRKYMKIIEAEDFKDGKVRGRTLFKFIITGKEKTADGKGIKKMIGYHKTIKKISDRLANRLLENGADIEVIKKFAEADWDPERVVDEQEDL
ncbi:ATPase, T2SS/T4P/T4SS family [Ruminiclostridium cellobioparum]|uniref:ATPase, T2SS/T4P/T4SS family n=1 Tax=Ruminiclostridium cellobioparum TaxID=29355 RepID=UPI0028A6DA38|nr:ATPase, T2SS/T4P/T4SS family [Ruminiclostridium cellobioparum]